MSTSVNIGNAQKQKEQTMNNQTIKADAGKPKVSLVPTQIIYDIAKVREYGNNKYPEGGPDNWKNVEIERYRDATYRHLLEYIKDPHGYDKESGLPHLYHLACNVAFLCELETFNIKIRKTAEIKRKPTPHPDLSIDDIMKDYWSVQILQNLEENKGIKPLPPEKKSLKSKINASANPVIARVSAFLKRGITNARCNENYKRRTSETRNFTRVSR